jgi:hypothetical protein
MTIPTYTDQTSTLLNPNTSILVTPTISPSNPAYMFCQVDIVLTLTRNASPDTSGFVTWSDVAATSLSALVTKNIVFNTVNYVPAFVGVFTVDLTYTWSGPTTLTRTFLFTVIDPCILNNAPPVSLPNYTAYIGDADFIQNIAITVGVAYQDYCIYSIYLASTKTTAPDTSATAITYTAMINQLYTQLPNAKITYNVSIPDLAHTGVYNLVVTYTWGGTGAVTSATVPLILTL